MRHNAPPPETRTRAFQLYCAGVEQKAIAAQVGVSEKTLSTWKRQGQWAVLRGPALLDGEVPPWGLRVLTLLSGQQQQLDRIEILLAALGAPPVPVTFPEPAANP